MPDHLRSVSALAEAHDRTAMLAHMLQ